MIDISLRRIRPDQEARTERCVDISAAVEVIDANVIVGEVEVEERNKYPEQQHNALPASAVSSTHLLSLLLP